MGILSGQVWDINARLWHMLNWMAKQMKEVPFIPFTSQKLTEIKFTMEPDIFTVVKK
jgi:hypothetical protein